MILRTLVQLASLLKNILKDGCCIVMLYMYSQSYATEHVSGADGLA